MTDPFKLLARLFLASFKIAGYGVSFGIQALWCVLHEKSDLISEAIGDFGRGVTDAIAEVFRGSS
jgi:hypothetical protein